MLSYYRKTRAQLASKALLLAGDPSGQRYTTTQVNNALNDAMLDIAMDVQLVKETLRVLLLEKDRKSVV